MPIRGKFLQSVVRLCVSVSLMLTVSIPTFADSLATRQIPSFSTNGMVNSLPIYARDTKTSSGYVYYDFLQQTYVGETIIGITYRGYNAGGVVSRHIILRMGMADGNAELPIVFEGDCTIPIGGTEEAPTDLLTIEFSSPVTITNQWGAVRMQLEAVGEAADHDVYFEYNSSKNAPVAIFTIQTAVQQVSVTGFVTGQEHEPLADITVAVTDDGGSVLRSTTTDAYGHFMIAGKLPARNLTLSMSEKGYPAHRWTRRLAQDGRPVALKRCMSHKAVYRKGQRATIISETPPDTSLGSYYKLDRVEGDKIIFEREEQPQARRPYIVFPTVDFEIDYPAEPERMLDTAKVEGAYMAGYYKTAIGGNTEDEYYLLFDTTADCSPVYMTDDATVSSLFQIGAMRAVLLIDRQQHDWKVAEYESPAWRQQFIAEHIVFTGTQADAATADVSTDSHTHAWPLALAGFVSNHENRLLPSVVVQLTTPDGTVAATTESDVEGHYLLPVPDDGADYFLRASAEGLPAHNMYATGDGWHPLSFSEGSIARNLMYSTGVAYTAGRRATIVMPCTPDATLGRYYRMDRRDGDTIYFAREKQPQANTPYIIVPTTDFTISYDASTLTGQGCETALPGVSFKGFMEATAYKQSESEYAILIDATTDCQYVYEQPHSPIEVGCTVGAMRAFLVLDSGVYSWDARFQSRRWPALYPYFTEHCLVLSDDATIAAAPLWSGDSTSPTARKPQTSHLYDLQGRRVSGTPRGGIYVSGGRKIIEKMKN